MKHNILYLMLAGLAIAGCDYTFDLDGKMDSGRKLFFQCIAGNEDTTIVRLYQTSPSAAPMTFYKDTVEIPDGTTYVYDVIVENTIEDNLIPNAADCVELTANGSPVKLYAAEGTVPRGCLYTLQKFNSGDMLEMKAHSEGVGSISAKAEMPSQFPLVSIRRSTDKDMEGNRVVWHTITYESTGAEEAFGVVVVWNMHSEKFYEDYVTYKNGEEIHVADTTVIWDWTRSLSVSESNRLFDTQSSRMIPFSLYGKLMNVWMDKGDGKKGQKQLSFKTETNGSREKEDGVTEKYKYILCRLTPETFRYLRSLNSIFNDSGLASFGLAPASYSYSNVRGGAGLLGAYSSLETDWETE